MPSKQTMIGYPVLALGSMQKSLEHLVLSGWSVSTRLSLSADDRAAPRAAKSKPRAHR